MARKTKKTAGWTLQGSKRPKGRYYQAVHGRGRGRVALTIGYLVEDQTEQARSRIKNMPAPSSLVVRCWDGHGDPPAPSKTALAAAAKSWLLDDSPADLLEALAESSRKEASRLEARGRYGDMRFEDFVERVYWPVRRARNEKTAKREKWLWDAIYPQLGAVKLKDLNMHRWTMFLIGKETWSPRSRQIVQNAYRACLKYAVKIGAIEEVHPMETIKGGNRRYTPPGESLSEEEVPLVLAAAHTPMHRAMFATAIGQGTRPGEVGSLRWDDVDWDRSMVRFQGASKNLQAREWVPMTGLTQRELEGWWLAQGSPKTGFAFAWKGRPVKCWTKSWKTALKKSGIDPEGTRRLIPYSVRYTYATLAAVAGVPRAAVRAGMRHSSSSRILETVYERLQDQQVASALEAFPACGG